MLSSQKIKNIAHHKEVYSIILLSYLRVYINFLPITLLVRNIPVFIFLHHALAKQVSWLK